MAIKILYIETVSIVGGAEVSLLGLLKNIDRQQFFPIVVCGERGELSNELKKIDIPIFYVPISKIKVAGFQLGKIRLYNPFILLENFVNSLITIKYFKKIILKEKISIIHANTLQGVFYGAVLSLLYKIPMIWHMRGHYIKFSPLQKLIFAFYAKFSTRIIANSLAVKATLAHISDKIVCIYNGLDLSDYELKDKNVENFSNLTSPVIGAIGRIVRIKSYEYFIRAANLILDKFPTATFVIVGEEEELDYYNELEEEIKRLDLEKHFIFTGYTNKVIDWLKSFDVLVHPSIQESFGRVVIEAMAAEVPVVASEVGGIPEIIENGENGFLISLKNPEKIATKVISLLNDEKLRIKFITNGKETVKRKFTNEIHTKQIENLYKTILISNEI